MSIKDATGCAIIPAETAIELYEQFAKKEYSARVKSRMKMQISPGLMMNV